MHPARYEETSGQVIYTIDCPKGGQPTIVSSDPKLFTSIRSHHLFPHDAHPPIPPRRRSYILEITDRCNLDCPICYAGTGSRGQSYRPLEEVRDLGKRITADGGRYVSLSGGEPTVHPQLPQIIAMLRGELGLSPYLITNGLRIAEDYDYLLTLKEAGLGKVKLQFDTLDNSVYKAMRGRHDLGEKYQAVDNVVSAGLRLGLVTTVCELNLGELGGILQYAQRFVPPLDSLVFQPLVPIGRFPAALKSVTREDIIHSLARCGGQSDLQTGDFLPFARLRSRRSGVHPDCSAHVFMSVDGDGTYPLIRDIDAREPRSGIKGPHARPPEQPSARVHRARGSRRSTRVDGPEVPGSTSGLRKVRRRRNLFLVSVIAYMRPETRDEDRLARCTVCTVARQGFSGLCQRSCSGQTGPISRE